MIILLAVGGVIAGTIIFALGKKMWDSNNCFLEAVADLVVGLGIATMIISFIFCVICTCEFFGSRNSYLIDASFVELQEERQALCYILMQGDNEGDGVVMPKMDAKELAEAVEEFNSTIRKGRLRMDDKWLKPYTYPYWYDIEPIPIWMVNKEVG